MTHRITLVKQTLANYIDKSSLFLYYDSKCLKHLVMIHLYGNLSEYAITIEKPRDCADKRVIAHILFLMFLSVLD